MKILILSTPRSGSTNLGKALGEVLNLKYIHEPFHIIRLRNNAFNYPKFINNFQVVKSLIYQKPKYTSDFYTDISTRFDRIILLSRENCEESAKSLHFARKSTNWDYPYTLSEKVNFNNEYHQQISYQTQLKEFSNLFNYPVTWYEKLYSGDKDVFSSEVSKWNIDFDIDLLFSYFNPLNRLRRGKIIKNLI